MAPPPEYDKEPKAPDKSATNLICEDTKALHNLVNDQQTNSDSKSSSTAAGTEVENKLIETLDDGQLRALLDEAITYKCPKDREGKSSLFKELLEEVEQDEQASEAAARGLSGNRAAVNRACAVTSGRGSRSRRALPHSNSLQDLVAALAAEPAPRRHHRAPPAPAPAPVSARAIHGGSLPSGVDTSFLIGEEPARGAGYLATVRCVNPPPLGERRVSTDANCSAELDALNRRSKPAFPMTYTARATLEIGSGAVCSGRAVTTTTASNQVRTRRPLAPTTGPPDRLYRHNKLYIPYRSYSKRNATRKRIQDDIIEQSEPVKAINKFNETNTEIDKIDVDYGKDEDEVAVCNTTLNDNKENQELSTIDNETELKLNNIIEDNIDPQQYKLLSALFSKVSCDKPKNNGGGSETNRMQSDTKIDNIDKEKDPRGPQDEDAERQENSSKDVKINKQDKSSLSALTAEVPAIPSVEIMELSGQGVGEMLATKSTTKTEEASKKINILVTEATTSKKEEKYNVSLPSKNKNKKAKLTSNSDDWTKNLNDWYHGLKGYSMNTSYYEDERSLYDTLFQEDVAKTNNTTEIAHKQYKQDEAYTTEQFKQANTSNVSFDIFKNIASGGDIHNWSALCAGYDNFNSYPTKTCNYLKQKNININEGNSNTKFKQPPPFMKYKKQNQEGNKIRWVLDDHSSSGGSTNTTYYGRDYDYLTKSRKEYRERIGKYLDAPKSDLINPKNIRSMTIGKPLSDYDEFDIKSLKFGDAVDQNVENNDVTTDPVGYLVGVQTSVDSCLHNELLASSISSRSIEIEELEETDEVKDIAVNISGRSSTPIHEQDDSVKISAIEPTDLAVEISIDKSTEIKKPEATDAVEDIAVNISEKSCTSIPEQDNCVNIAAIEQTDLAVDISVDKSTEIKELEAIHVVEDIAVNISGKSCTSMPEQIVDLEPTDLAVDISVYKPTSIPEKDDSVNKAALEPTDLAVDISINKPTSIPEQDDNVNIAALEPTDLAVDISINKPTSIPEQDDNVNIAALEPTDLAVDISINKPTSIPEQDDNVNIAALEPTDLAVDISINKPTSIPEQDDNVNIAALEPTDLAVDISVYKPTSIPEQDDSVNKAALEPTDLAVDISINKPTSIPEQDDNVNIATLEPTDLAVDISFNKPTSIPEQDDNVNIAALEPTDLALDISINKPTSIPEQDDSVNIAALEPTDLAVDISINKPTSIPEQDDSVNIAALEPTDLVVDISVNRSTSITEQDDNVNIAALEPTDLAVDISINKPTSIPEQDDNVNIAALEPTDLAVDISINKPTSIPEQDDNVNIAALEPTDLAVDISINKPTSIPEQDDSVNIAALEPNDLAIDISVGKFTKIKQLKEIDVVEDIAVIVSGESSTKIPEQDDNVKIAATEPSEISVDKFSDVPSENSINLEGESPTEDNEHDKGTVIHTICQPGQVTIDTNERLCSFSLKKEWSLEKQLRLPPQQHEGLDNKNTVSNVNPTKANSDNDVELTHSENNCGLLNCTGNESRSFVNDLNKDGNESLSDDDSHVLIKAIKKVKPDDMSLQNDDDEDKFRNNSNGVTKLNDFLPECEDTSLPKYFVEEQKLREHDNSSENDIELADMSSASQECKVFDQNEDKEKNIDECSTNRQDASFQKYVTGQEKLFKALEYNLVDSFNDNSLVSNLDNSEKVHTNVKDEFAEIIVKQNQEEYDENVSNVICPKGESVMDRDMAADFRILVLRKNSNGPVVMTLPFKNFPNDCIDKKLGPLALDYYSSNTDSDKIQPQEVNDTRYLITFEPDKKSEKRKSKKKTNKELEKKKIENANKKALKAIMFEDRSTSPRQDKSMSSSLSSVSIKEVDSAIPFSCITTPEVVASCNTTSSTQQAAVAVDTKPLQQSPSYRAVASLVEPTTPPRAASPPPAPAPAPLARATPTDQPRSVISSSFNGLPLSRPNYGSTSTTSQDEYKKSIDENGNSVQGFSSPLSGSSQHKKPRRKKSSKNETVIKSHQIDGYQGNKDLNEVLRFIESAADTSRAGKLGRAKHRDDADDKGGKKRSGTRKDKESKMKRATSMEELSCSRMEDLTDKPSPPARAPRHSDQAKAERRSWGEDAREAATRFFREEPIEVPAPDTEFQTVTKKRKPRRRADDAGDPPRAPRAQEPRARRVSAPPSDRSNDSNDDMDSVHSLPAEGAARGGGAGGAGASYADIARTRHNIPDLIESCNFYTEPDDTGERVECLAVAECSAGVASPPGDAEYPALEPPPRPPAPPPPAAKHRPHRHRKVERTESSCIRNNGSTVTPASVAEWPAPDVVADRRPAVILLDAADARDMDGVTFGFDINETLLGGPARRPRCDLIRDAIEVSALPNGAPAPGEGGGGGGAGGVAAGCGLRYLPPAPRPLAPHTHQIIDYVGGAWEDVVRCGAGKVLYYSE